jgi:hypothetical protein
MIAPTHKEIFGLLPSIEEVPGSTVMRCDPDQIFWQRWLPGFIPLPLYPLLWPAFMMLWL